MTTAARSTSLGILLCASILALAGCRRADDSPASTPLAPEGHASSAATAVTPPTGTDAATRPEGVLLAYVWNCDDGTSFVMQNLLAERAVSLELPEGPRRLPQVVSASGARYDDGTLVFWTKGDTATFERKGSVPVSCREARAQSLVADAKARGVAYLGRGNEPGWVLEVTLPRTVVFTTNYGQDRHEFTNASHEGDPESGAVYTATRDDSSIQATLTLETCQDDMSGELFDLSVVVQFDGRTLRGCGTSLR